jgi:uncharacterized protein YdeI (YjbR/CyaY-like superfamily)
MPRDPRVSAYIAARAEFARPILEHLRDRIHSVCPEAEETLKWSMPAFLYKGEQLAHMAAFKAHASFGFWKGELITGPAEEREGMGQFGRIGSLADLPDDASLEAMIRKAMALTDEGVKRNRPKAAPKPPPELPGDFGSALAGSAAASSHYEAFSPSAKREYVEWILDAKRPETRASRIGQAVEWIAEGKKRNWKYENC